MMWGDTIYTGVFFKKEALSLDQAEKVLETEGPMSSRPLGLDEEQAKRIIQRMM